MAEYVAKPGTGSVFKNENKTEDWHGDYTGTITLPDGAVHYVNVYNNVGKTSGKPYLGISIGKQVQSSGNNGAGTAPRNQGAGEEALPF